MNWITYLYKLLLCLSASGLMIGFLVNILFNKNKSDFTKMLMFMAFVNFASISIYFLNLYIKLGENWNLFYIFLNATIVILNIIIGHFTFLAKGGKNEFDKLILTLFGSTFIFDTVIIFLIAFFEAKNKILYTQNGGFWWFTTFFSLLMFFGTILPTIRAYLLYRLNKNETSRLLIILSLNLINNLVGFYLLIAQTTSNEIGIFLNLITNLSFSYYLGYELLREYFIRNKISSFTNLNEITQVYSWDEFKKHLGNWNEVKSYLMKHRPETLIDVEHYQLTDLEKIHLCLKKLKVSSKDAAEVLNVSIRTIETQRYRIGRKISS